MHYFHNGQKEKVQDKEAATKPLPHGNYYKDLLLQKWDLMPKEFSQPEILSSDDPHEQLAMLAMATILLIARKTVQYRTHFECFIK